MKLKKTLRNLVKYKTIKLMPQVDPEVMKPIFEKNLKGKKFYSEKDHLNLWNKDKNTLIFQYSAHERFQIIFFNGTIHAKKPRRDFGKIDNISYMDIDMLSSDKRRELITTVKGIANYAGIERVTTKTLVGADPKDLEELNKIRALPLHQHLMYQLR